MSVWFRERLRSASSSASSAVLALGLMFVVTGSATAQRNCNTNPGSCSTGGALNVTIRIGKVVLLGVSPGSTVLTVPTPADFDAGYTTTNGPSVTVRANTPWALGISSSVVNWIATSTQTEPARANKPASDLSWATSAGGPFTDLATATASVATGIRTAGTTVTLFYQTTYSWTLDTPGVYLIPVVFTITAP